MSSKPFFCFDCSRNDKLYFFKSNDRLYTDYCFVFWQSLWFQSSLSYQMQVKLPGSINIIHKGIQQTNLTIAQKYVFLSFLSFKSTAWNPVQKMPMPTSSEIKLYHHGKQKALKNYFFLCGGLIQFPMPQWRMKDWPLTLLLSYSLDIVNKSIFWYKQKLKVSDKTKTHVV